MKNVGFSRTKNSDYGLVTCVAAAFVCAQYI